MFELILSLLAEGRKLMKQAEPRWTEIEKVEEGKENE